MNRFSAVVVRSVFAGGLVATAAACSDPAPAPAPASVVKTPAERVARYQACWKHFNDKAWDQLQTCYTENAVSEAVDSMPASASGRAAIVESGKAGATAFPDRRGELRLVLTNGDKVLGIAVWTGTNTGDLPPGPDGSPVPATGKPIGVFIAHAGDWNATGDAVTHDAVYQDEGTTLAQLGLSTSPARPVEKATGNPPTVVMGNGGETEKANLSATQAMFDVLNRHDLKGLEAFMADDYRGIAVAEARDVDKKSSLAGTKEMFTGFPDVKITPADVWAAGDYTVVVGTFEGTMTGDMPAMNMKKTGNKVSTRFLEVFKFADGKVQEDWLFYNGAAMMAQLVGKK